jgi:hypothetical protein
MNLFPTFIDTHNDILIMLDIFSDFLEMKAYIKSKPLKNSPVWGYLSLRTAHCVAVSTSLIG